MGRSALVAALVAAAAAGARALEVQSTLIGGVTDVSARVMLIVDEAFASDTLFLAVREGTLADVGDVDPAVDAVQRVLTVSSLTGVAEVADLTASTTYVARAFRLIDEVWENVAGDNNEAQFTTFPTANEPATISFAFGCCSRTNSKDEIWRELRQREPLFFIYLGEMFFMDEDENNPGTDAYDRRYASTFNQKAQSRFLRQTPLVYMWDDRDYAPDGRADSNFPGRAAARTSYQRWMPHYPLAIDSGAADISPYHAFTVARVRFIVTELRSESTGSTTTLGTAQKNWLLGELGASSEYALVVWVSTKAWQGRDGYPNQSSWGHFPEERREIADFIQAQDITNLVMLSGASEVTSIDDGTNTDYSSDGGAGFPVFNSGPLDWYGDIIGCPYSEGWRGYRFVPNHHYGIVEITDPDAADPSQVTVSWKAYREEGSNSDTLMQWEGAHPFVKTGDRDDSRICQIDHFPPFIWLWVLISCSVLILLAFAVIMYKLRAAPDLENTVTPRDPTVKSNMSVDFNTRDRAATAGNESTMLDSPTARA